eukprot:g152.t1
MDKKTKLTIAQLGAALTYQRHRLKSEAETQNLFVQACLGDETSDKVGSVSPSSYLPKTVASAIQLYDDEFGVYNFPQPHQQGSPKDALEFIRELFREHKVDSPKELLSSDAIENAWNERMKANEASSAKRKETMSTLLSELNTAQDLVLDFLSKHNDALPNCTPVLMAFGLTLNPNLQFSKKALSVAIANERIKRKTGHDADKKRKEAYATRLEIQKRTNNLRGAVEFEKNLTDEEKKKKREERLEAEKKAMEEIAKEREMLRKILPKNANDLLKLYSEQYDEFPTSVQVLQSFSDSLHLRADAPKDPSLTYANISKVWRENKEAADRRAEEKMKQDQENDATGSGVPQDASGMLALFVKEHNGTPPANPGVLVSFAKAKDPGTKLKYCEISACLAHYKADEDASRKRDESKDIVDIPETPDEAITEFVEAHNGEFPKNVQSLRAFVSALYDAAKLKMPKTLTFVKLKAALMAARDAKDEKESETKKNQDEKRNLKMTADEILDLFVKEHNELPSSAKLLMGYANLKNQKIKYAEISACLKDRQSLENVKSKVAKDNVEKQRGATAGKEEDHHPSSKNLDNMTLEDWIDDFKTDHNGSLPVSPQLLLLFIRHKNPKIKIKYTNLVAKLAIARKKEKEPEKHGHSLDFKNSKEALHYFETLHGHYPKNPVELHAFHEELYRQGGTNLPDFLSEEKLEEEWKKGKASLSTASKGSHEKLHLTGNESGEELGDIVLEEFVKDHNGNLPSSPQLLFLYFRHTFSDLKKINFGILKASLLSRRLKMRVV